MCSQAIEPPFCISQGLEHELEHRRGCPMRTQTLAQQATARVQRGQEVLSSGWQVPEWGSRSTCRTEDPDSLFPDNGRPPASLTDPCKPCPVRAECLEFALEGPWMPYGPWGGLPQSEVQSMWLARHPRDRTDGDTVLAYIGAI